MLTDTNTELFEIKVMAKYEESALDIYHKIHPMCDFP